MAKRALCIGINDYPGSDADLAGCINDADDWASFLSGKGFEVGVLANGQATKSAIVSSIRVMLKTLRAGDTAVLQYSGHGTWMPDYSGDEPDRKDEALCPYDMDESNLILDDELAQLFKSRPVGTTVVFISDCCHSGTMHRFAGKPGVKRKIRFLPPANFVKNPETLQKISEATLDVKPRAMRSDAPLPGIIHISGCSDREYSYDAVFNGRPNGAFTYFALQALRAGTLTYKQLFQAIRNDLPSWEYPQSPRLNAERSAQNAVAFA